MIGRETVTFLKVSEVWKFIRFKRKREGEREVSMSAEGVRKKGISGIINAPHTYLLL